MKEGSDSDIATQTTVLTSAIRDVFPHAPASVIAALRRFCEEPMEAIVSQALITFEKPYGRNHILQVGQDFGISCACFLPRQETSFHYHLQRMEFYYVRAGVLQLHRPDGFVNLPAGRFANSLPGQHHRLRNPGNCMLEVVELFCPPLLDDKIRMADSYGRNVGKVTRFQ